MLQRTTFPLALFLFLLHHFASAQWVQTNGPFGGRVRCFALTPAAAGGTSLFAGTDDGVWLSTNNGTNWKATNSGLPYPSLPIMGLTISPDGAGGMNIIAASWGVFLSTNNGSSWTAINNGLPGGYVTALAASPNGKGGTNLIAGTTNDVFLSTNNGARWQSIRKNLPPWEPGAMAAASSLALCLNDTGGTIILAAIPDYGAFRLPINAESWAGMWQGGLRSRRVGSFVISSRGGGGFDLYACTTDSGIFRSTNAGVTWTPANSGLTNLSVRAFAVKPNTTGGSSLFAATGGGLFLSTNNYAEWEAVNTDLASTDIIALAASSNADDDSYLFAGTEAKGVFRSTDDGANWTAASTGLTTTDVLSLAFGPGGGNDMNLFAGSLRGTVSRSTDGGQGWIGLKGGVSDHDILALAVSPGEAGGSNVFAGTDGGLYRSIDNGESWTPTNPPLNTTVTYAFAVSDTSVFAGCGNGIFHTTDGGARWMNIGLATTAISSLAIDHTGTTRKTLFAGSHGSGVFRSSDNGISWTAAKTGLPNLYLTGLALGSNPAGGTYLFGCAFNRTYPDPWPKPHQGGVFVSTDDGTSWITIDSGLTNTDVNALAVSSNGTGGTVFFAGTNSGVYLLTNEGQKWIASHAGLTNRVVRSLMVCGKQLYAGISGSGVWRRPLSEMTTAAKRGHDILPPRFLLCQNYPNPFNPGTTIRYGLPERSHVTLTVFNTLGQQVTQLVNSEVDAGYHDVEFDGSHLTSGVYLCRMRVNEHASTVRLLLIR